MFKRKKYTLMTVEIGNSEYSTESEGYSNQSYL